MTRPDLARTAMPALAVALAALLAGCGAATKTVSVPSAPVSSAPAPTASTAAQPRTTTAPTPSATATTGSAGSGGTPASTGTRTAPEPEFAEKQGAGSAEGLAGALATLRAHGYSANDTADYHPDQTLRVLVGTRIGSGDGYDQRAFFFVDGRYIGADTSEPSAQVKVLSQSDTEVTLAYPLYRSSDPLCCPGGGQAQVRFQLNDGRLTALDPIPAVEPETGLARR